MSKFLYPVDTDQFQLIREQGKLYIDKTDMVYNLVHKYQFVFLARPRRFGKSLLCNTLKAYFQGQKELFHDLMIMEMEKEWKQYPVLHFDMSQMRNCTSLECMQEVLSAMLEKYETYYGTSKHVEDHGTRLDQLLRYIYETHNQQVVIIIDEYDTPLIRNLYNKETKDAIRNLLRGFYQTLKLDGAYLRFVFITGITKFSQLSIFSELNNLKQISMFDEFSGLCGITKEELEGVMRPCVQEYAEALGITIKEAYAVLKKNYDGYRFSRKGKLVYAPFSLLNALSDKTCNYYWFESATSTALIEHLKHYPEFNPLDCDGIELCIDEFNAPCESARTPFPLLYQSGYLTIGDYDAEINTYTLRFPNNEVRHGMVYGMTSYLMDINDTDRNATILAMAKALVRGNLQVALTALRSWIAEIPYDIITKKQWMAKKDSEAFYKLLMYIVFSLLNSKVQTEVKSIRGRADVVIKTKSDIFVLEIKVDKDVNDALAQIDDKGYSIPYEADGRKVTKCGVCLSSEARNITHWKITDEHGGLVDEQMF